MRHPHAVVARSLLVVTLVGAALSACAGSSGSSGSALTSSDVTGTWSEPSSKPVVELELLADGSVSGSDGCNKMNGTWKIDGSEIQFGPFAATMMACENVDTWLSGASKATVDGSTMTILDDGSKKIGTLEKQS
ncbi:META domain-containing protein [Cellulomonas sp. McL0617]|uniref:META domain-containing protein n=1 Tax=Cellulomonas sp. McL0617 TaxID=3415675 RepID=UPI003CEBDEB3